MFLAKRGADADLAIINLEAPAHATAHIKDVSQDIKEGFVLLAAAIGNLKFCDTLHTAGEMLCGILDGELDKLKRRTEELRGRI
ncbi:hypothetical protein PG995_009998 [Apiospora arundinis]